MHVSSSSYDMHVYLYALLAQETSGFGMVGVKYSGISEGVGSVGVPLHLRVRCAKIVPGLEARRLACRCSGDLD